MARFIITTRPKGLTALQKFEGNCRKVFPLCCSEKTHILHVLPGETPKVRMYLSAWRPIEAELYKMTRVAMEKMVETHLLTSRQTMKHCFHEFYLIWSHIVLLMASRGQCANSRTSLTCFSIVSGQESIATIVADWRSKSFFFCTGENGEWLYDASKSTTEVLCFERRPVEKKSEAHKKETQELESTERAQGSRKAASKSSVKRKSKAKDKSSKPAKKKTRKWNQLGNLLAFLFG